MFKSKFGVSLICYNEEKNLSKCLDSIFDQSIKPSQVVIIDDMSTDDTPNIIRRYIEKNPLIVSYRTNAKKTIKGINISYAIHLSLSSLLENNDLQYIVRMDTDAILINKDTFKTLLDIMDKNPMLGVTGAYYGKVSKNHVGDAVRIYRKECLIDIIQNNPLEKQKNFYPLMFGHDSFMVWRAKYHGYLVKPSNIKYYDVRPYRRKLLQWYQTGWFRYMNGFSILNQIAFMMRHVNEDPIIIGSLVSFMTYLLCYFLPKNRFESSYTQYIYSEYNKLVIDEIYYLLKKHNSNHLRA